MNWAALALAFQLAAGKAVYQVNCTACHNRDPRLQGAIGPDVAGSSTELLEARLLRRGYPEGYKPKRKTKIMPAFPQLKDKIPALADYLRNIK